MKKLLLLASGMMLCMFANAQKVGVPNDGRIPNLSALSSVPVNGGPDKVTKNGDTDQRSHILGTDSLFVYYADVAPHDSGYVSGYNAFGYKGFTERFDVQPNDSAVLPIGVFGYLTGRANVGSTKTIRAGVWSQGPTTQVRTHLYFTGVPVGTPGNSAQLTLGQLRTPSGIIDTIVYMQFPNISNTYMTDSFFAGFDFGTSGYNWTTPGLGGDSVWIVMNKSMTGGRHADGGVASPGYVLKGADTLVNVQNATQLNTGTWVDNLNGGANGLFNNFFIGVVFRVKYLSVNGISRNGLTVFGTVPNPATNSTMLKLSLKATTDVTVQIIDMMGRTVVKQPSQHLTAGAHDLPINTSALPAGTYNCLVYSSQGDAMGIEMSVVK